MTNAGILRENITIQANSGITNTYGEVSENWVDVMKIKAGVTYNSGSKTTENMEIYNSQTLTFTTYIRPITESMRIVWKGIVYSILFMPTINYDYMIITAEKQKN